MVTDPMTLEQMRMQVPLPPGMSLEQARSLSPSQLQALRKQRNKEIETIRDSYSRMVGRTSSNPLTDEELASMINDPGLQGRLAGQRQASRSARLKQYTQAYENARKSSRGYF